MENFSNFGKFCKFCKFWKISEILENFQKDNEIQNDDKITFFDIAEISQITENLKKNWNVFEIFPP